MNSAWIRAILILPGNVLVTIPELLLYFTGYQWPEENRLPWLIAGGVLFAAGLALAIWTMRLFAVLGKGTAAPWDPPKRLVVAGPYRHVRNPMITSVLTMLVGEFLILSSTVIAIWFGVFLLIQILYFPLVEEKELERRFGDDYVEYRKNVPRWIPRISAWIPAEASEKQQE